MTATPLHKIRVDDATWERWKAAAPNGNVSGWLKSLTNEPIAAPSDVPEGAQEIAEVVLVAEQTRASEDARISFLDEVLRFLAGAAERPSGPVEPVEVVSKPGGIERAPRPLADRAVVEAPARGHGYSALVRCSGWRGHTSPPRSRTSGAPCRRRRSHRTGCRRPRYCVKPRSNRRRAEP